MKLRNWGRAAVPLVLLGVLAPAAFASGPLPSHQWRLAHSDPGFVDSGAKSHPTFVYDEATRQVVAYVGQVAGVVDAYRPGTWTWDGGEWRAATGAEPAWRKWASMVYDPATRQVILFGGCCKGKFNGQADSYVPYGETWIWDGRHWSKASGAGPPGRYLTSMAYDSATQRVVLFGGGCGDPITDQTRLCADTWSWDGKRWTEVASSGPTPREDAAMTYDPATRQVVLVGGCCHLSGGNSVDFGDTWIWTGARWNRVHAELPPRVGSSLVYDVAGARLVLFGGTNGAGWDDSGPSQYKARFLADTWTWNGKAWAQHSSGLGVGPAPRFHASAVYDPTYPVASPTGTSYGALLLFGGVNANGALGDLWLWHGGRWAKGPAGPQARQGAGLAYDAATRQVVLFGGLGNAAWGPYLEDTWLLRGKAWTTHRSPLTQTTEAIAYDAASKQLVLFGSAGSAFYDVPPGPGQTWVWNGRSWRLASASGPAARLGASMVYDAAAGELVLFGGEGASGLLTDTWTWNGKSWKQDGGRRPPPHLHVDMVYDAAARQVVLYGNCSADLAAPASYACPDTWTWDASGWKQPLAPGPTDSQSEWSAMVYDAARGKVVLLDHKGLTWTWDGASWTAHPGLAPPPRQSGAIVYDAGHRTVVYFGGMDLAGTYLSDTWVWDGASWSQAPGASPPGRAMASLAYGPAAGRVVLAGGIGAGRGALGDTWTWDGQRWAQVPGVPPATTATYRLPLVYDAATQQLVRYGDARDTWVY